MVQAKVIRVVTSKQKDVLAGKEEVVNLVSFLLNYHMSLGPQTRLGFDVLFLNPLSAFGVIPHVFSDFDQKFAQSIQAFVFSVAKDHTPEGLSISSSGIAIDELS